MTSKLLTVDFNPQVQRAGQVNMVNVAQQKLATNPGDAAEDEGEGLEMLEEGEEEVAETDPPQD